MIFNAPQEVKAVSILGYDLDELYEFACVCKKCGLEPGEIKDFSKAVRKAYGKAIEAAHEEVRRCIAEQFNASRFDLDFLPDGESKK